MSEISLTYTEGVDPGGNRVPIAVFAPTTAGKYPLVVFSHGLSGSVKSVSDLVSAWAESGYVVAVPVHVDSKDYPYEKPDDGGVAASWIRRASDLSLVLDQPELVAGALPFGVSTSAARPIIAGHSAGAFDAMVLTGVDVHDPETGAPVQLQDSRFIASVVISGQGVEVEGFDTKSYLDWHVPRLVISGTLDVGPFERDPQGRTDPFFLSPDGPKFLAWFTGATHLSFVGSAGGDVTPADIETLAYTQQTTTAFFQAVLSGGLRRFDQTLTALEHRSEGRDYSRFASMLAERGKSGSGRVLSERAAAVMMRDHLPPGLQGDLRSGALFGYGGSGKDMGFGYGGAVTLERAGAGESRMSGAYGWGGGASTTFWADPRRGLAVVFFTQLLPSGSVPVYDLLSRRVYSALHL